jgi:hypothetical protein
MNFRKHMVLIVAGCVALLLVAIAVFMLVRSRGAYQQVNRQYDSTRQRLTALYRRDPYPSDENVRLMQTNSAVLEDYFAKQFAALRKDQLEPGKMEPAEFPLVLEKTIRKLHARAVESAVTLPSRFAFGFERYAAGALPNAADVPRLVLQLRSIEELSGLLLQSKIASIVSVKRTIFERGAQAEGAGDAGSGRGGRRRFVETPADSSVEEQPKEDVDPSGLFSREGYELTFEGRDAAIWDVLNALARCKAFAVVSRVELVNEAPLPKPAAEKAEAPVPPADAPNRMDTLFGAAPEAPAKPVKSEILSHEERVVAGREFVKAVMDVDLYRFLSEQKPEQQEATP